MAGIEDMLSEARKSIGLGEPNHIQDWYADRNGAAFNYNFAWCNAAITYWAVKSGNYAAVCHGTDYAYTPWHAERFFDEGEWYSGTSANVRNAKPGDIVFFDWGGSNSRGRIDHVGVVEKNLGNGVLQTIEGNTGNKCRRRTRNASTIAGYGRPAYKNSTPTPPDDPDDKTPHYWSWRWNGKPLHVPEDHVHLMRGDFDSMQVKRLQNAMNLVFGENLLVDGDFGPKTEAAVKRMQTSLGVPTSGEYDDATADALFDHIEAELNKPDPDPDPDPEPEPDPGNDSGDNVDDGPPPDDNPDVPSGSNFWNIDKTIQVPFATPPGEISKGMKGSRVTLLQMALNEALCDDDLRLAATGTFDDATQRALVVFQLTHKDENGIPLRFDGVYDDHTARSLYLTLR